MPRPRVTAYFCRRDDVVLAGADRHNSCRSFSAEARGAKKMFNAKRNSSKSKTGRTYVSLLPSRKAYIFTETVVGPLSYNCMHHQEHPSHYTMAFTPRLHPTHGKTITTSDNFFASQGMPCRRARENSTTKTAQPASLYFDLTNGHFCRHRYKQSSGLALRGISNTDFTSQIFPP